MQETQSIHPIFISSIRLFGFRTYHEIEVSIERSVVVLFGNNGVGKTNFLEAVSMLSAGKGFRRAYARDIARCKEDGWSVSSRFLDSDYHNRFLTVFSRDDMGKGRYFSVDGNCIKHADVGNYISVIWLTPFMDQLWVGGAAERRKFFDRIVLSFYPKHAVNIMLYTKVMQERNMLLRQEQRGVWLDAIDNRIAAIGTEIVKARVRTVDLLNRKINKEESIFPDMKVSVDGKWEKTYIELANDELWAEGVEGKVRNLFTRFLFDGRSRDARMKRTMEGPHLSDIKVKHLAKECFAGECSTGEQKLLLVGVVLACVRAVGCFRGVFPLLVLDELVAHLDERWRRVLLEELLLSGSQVFISGIRQSHFDSLHNSAQLYHVMYDDGVSYLHEAEGIL